ncbi:MAG: hypothetical protein CMO81_02580 [Waddliaceae bacterium]|nr:hypothetical protein [Waddliaceae bacterium]
MSSGLCDYAGRDSLSNILDYHQLSYREFMQGGLDSFIYNVAKEDVAWKDLTRTPERGLTPFVIVANLSILRRQNPIGLDGLTDRELRVVLDRQWKWINERVYFSGEPRYIDPRNKNEDPPYEYRCLERYFKGNPQNSIDQWAQSRFLQTMHDNRQACGKWPIGLAVLTLPTTDYNGGFLYDSSFCNLCDLLTQNGIRLKVKRLSSLESTEIWSRKWTQKYQCPIRMLNIGGHGNSYCIEMGLKSRIQFNHVLYGEQGPLIKRIASLCSPDVFVFLSSCGTAKDKRYRPNVSQAISRQFFTICPGAQILAAPQNGGFGEVYFVKSHSNDDIQAVFKKRTPYVCLQKGRSSQRFEEDGAFMNIHALSMRSKL